MRTTSERSAWFALAALALFALGVALSRCVEAGIRIEAAILPGNIPALQFSPLGPGPHPIALLVHGVTASKETLFRLGEAFAASGFIACAIDLPGHGESARPFLEGGNASTIASVARTLERVDVFVGHSMGAYAGAQSARDGGLRPRLFVAIGALPDLGRHGPPLLLLAGRFEEAVPLARLRERADARLVVSNWSDHALEPFDPLLVEAAVGAASAAVGKTPAAAPTRWRLRLVGMMLALLGALALGDQLPRVFHRLARLRGFVLSVILILAIALTAGSWVGAVPILRRVPVQLAAAAGLALVIIGAWKLRVPRWSLAAATAAIVVLCVTASAYFLALVVSLLTLVLAAGAVVGMIAEGGGTRGDGDVAMATLVGYALGQWMPIGF